MPHDIGNTKWLDLLRRFCRIAGVKNLHTTEPLGLPVMSALATLTGDRVTVLLTLQNTFIEGTNLDLSEKLLTN